MDGASVRDILQRTISQEKPNSNWIRETEIFIDGHSIRIQAPGYTVYMNKGRRAGKRPPMDAIKSWLKEKGMAESLYWAVSTKIAREGTTGIGEKWLDDAVNEITENDAKDILSEFDDAFNKIL